jgi:hypothetical protein
MVMVEALFGMVMAGTMVAPLEVTSCPVEDTLKLPSRE